MDDGGVRVADHRVPIERELPTPKAGAKLELGVRPEFVSFVEPGIPGALPVQVVGVRDTGRNRIVDTDFAGHKVRALVPEGVSIPEGTASVRFAPQFTQVYANSWILE